MPMKMKVQEVFDATLVISKIIRDARPMPTTGKFRLARMHAKLLPEFTTINTQRDELIKSFDHHTTSINDVGEEVVSQEFSVPLDKMPEFTDTWKKIGDEEIGVDVEPIPLKCIDLGGMVNGSIEAHELATLGDLITE